MGEGGAVTKYSSRRSMTQKTKGRWKKLARERSNAAELIICYHSKKRVLIDEEESIECEEGRKKMRGNELGEYNTQQIYW